jgi:hypothetical protein
VLSTNVITAPATNGTNLMLSTVTIFAPLRIVNIIQPSLLPGQVTCLAESNVTTGEDELLQVWLKVLVQPLASVIVTT